MTYWALNVWFLAVVAVVGVLAVLRLARRGRPVGVWFLGVGVTLVVLLVMTAVFDNVMIGIGLVGYDPNLISGAKIGIAPLEDFAYAIAGVVLLPSLWVLLERRPVAGAGVGSDADRGGGVSESPSGEVSS